MDNRADGLESLPRSQAHFLHTTHAPSKQGIIAGVIRFVPFITSLSRVVMDFS